MAQKLTTDLPGETSVHERTKRLRGLMKAHRMSSRDVAAMLGRSEMTVRIWSCRHPARVIPQNTLRLLELELSLRGDA